jgi:DNA-binding transcriptional ArsR family regulator
MDHYEEMARLGQAFGSPVRLRLLDLLRQSPRSVEALSEEAQLPVANVSQHLRQLRAAHVVSSERQGQRVVYQLAGPMVSSFFVAFRTFGEMLLPELDRLRNDIQGAEPRLTPAAFKQLLARGKVLVVDVRPNVEYQHGHFEDAVSIPLDELPSRLHELPRSKVVVTTCRGPYCPPRRRGRDPAPRGGLRGGPLRSR